MKMLPQTPNEAQIVRRLRAIANPVRYRIVQILAARGTCVCGDLANDLPLAQSTVSEHLAVLKEAGIVRGTISGPTTCYCLDSEVLQTLAAALADLSSLAAGGQGDCCPT
jgi:ArsR family transcriptional regulator